LPALSAGRTASRAPLTAPLAAPASTLPITFSAFFTKLELFTLLAALVSPDLLAMRGSADFFVPLFFRLAFLALAREGLDFFFEEEALGLLPVREALAWERALVEGMILLSPLVDKTDAPSKRPFKYSNLAANAERVSAICSWISAAEGSVLSCRLFAL